jgi:hypothetical protein
MLGVAAARQQRGGEEMGETLSEVGGDGLGSAVGMPTLKMEGSMFLTAEMPDGVVLSFFFSGGAADKRRATNAR